ncbi:MAG: YncE family protein [Caldilineaceae bacterium]
MMQRIWFNLVGIATLGALLAGCRPVVATQGSALRAQSTPTVAAATAAATAAGTAGEHSGDEVIATIPVGNYAGARVVFDGGTAWVTNAEDGTMSRIDVGTNQVVDTLTIGEKGGTYGSPTTAVSAVGSLWVTDNAAHALVRLDPATSEVLATIPLAVEPWQIDASEGAIWVSALDAGKVIRIDPNTNAVVATIDVPSASDFAVTDGAVWVTNLRLGTVTRLDPQTNTVVATIDTPGPGQENERPESIAVGPEGVYVMDKRAQIIHLIDPATNEVMQTKPTGGFTIVMALGDEGMWTVDCDTGTPLLLDAKTLERIAELGPHPDACGITLDEGSIWLTTSNSVVRVARPH